MKVVLGKLHGLVGTSEETPITTAWRRLHHLPFTCFYSSMSSLTLYSRDLVQRFVVPFGFLALEQIL